MLVQGIAAKHYAEHDGKPFFEKVRTWSGDMTCSRSLPCSLACHPTNSSRLRTCRQCIPFRAPLQLTTGNLCGPMCLPVCVAFAQLVNFLSSGPVVAMVWEGKEVVKYGRTMIGATNPLASAPGTIRGDYGIDVGRNIIHGSDSVEVRRGDWGMMGRSVGAGGGRGRGKAWLPQPLTLVPDTIGGATALMWGDGIDVAQHCARVRLCRGRYRRAGGLVWHALLVGGRGGAWWASEGLRV